MNRALLKMTTINQALHDHRRSLLEQERHTASLEVRHNTGHGAEVEIVNGQLDRNMGAFTTDEDFVTEPHPYGGWRCYHKDHDWAPDAKNTTFQGHGATEAEAIEDYKDLNDLCDGPTDTKEKWFRDYENHYENDDDGYIMQQRARNLRISGSDWAAYHRRREAATEAF